jgi:pimeloyl-ACP methyl ester carboxylesterase
LPFDVVGFDPRGVGDSQGLDCTQQEDVSAHYAAEGAAGAIEAFRANGESCRASAGPLFDHLGTNAVVSDIEQIRIALGVQQLTFYGISYGTRLGAVYAQRYPERIRALVLDSPMPPTADYPELVNSQFEALLTAHQALISSCEQGQLPCPRDAAGLFQRLLQAFDQASLRAGFLGLWALQLSNPPGRDFLVRLLTEVESVTDDQLAMLLVMEAMLEATPQPGLLLPEVTVATNLTVNCSDSITEPPSAIEAEAWMADYTERSELFGLQALPSIVCAGWPAPRDPVPPVAFRLQTPPLIIAGTADTLTPLHLAEELHDAIPGSALLVSEHYGHGAISFGSACTGMAIGRYLGGLVLPPEGTVCPPP